MPLSAAPVQARLACRPEGPCRPAPGLVKPLGGLWAWAGGKLAGAMWQGERRRMGQPRLGSRDKPESREACRSGWRAGVRGSGAMAPPVRSVFCLGESPGAATARRVGQAGDRAPGLSACVCPSLTVVWGHAQRLSWRGTCVSENMGLGTLGTGLWPRHVNAGLTPVEPVGVLGGCGVGRGSPGLASPTLPRCPARLRVRGRCRVSSRGRGRPGGGGARRGGRSWQGGRGSWQVCG